MTDATDASDPPSGTLTFLPSRQPPLKSGDYALTVRQRVSGAGFDETFQASLSFAVLGPRFSLPAGTVTAQFPPPTASGDFDGVLPHVVLADPTLPWQRDCGAQGADGPLPWLALLCFDDGDPIPALVTGTLGDLTGADGPVRSYPGLTLEYGESPADACQYIDVPAPLFAAVAPSAEDMRWLTHARSVDTAGDKHAGAEGGAGTDYAVVAGNRLPAPGRRTTCFLVSLEGMADVLPGSGVPLPDGVTTLRLAVLASWWFMNADGQETFKGWFDGLNRSPSTLQVPYPAAGQTANPVVQAALAGGYTALDQRTRSGTDAVAWYRGPLLPFAVPDTVGLPAQSADALTGTVPGTGMADTSLAVAWQIGRLLALSDKGFATLLYRWKRQQAREAVSAFESKLLAQHFGLADADAPHDAVVNAALAPAVASTLQQSMD